MYVFFLINITETRTYTSLHANTTQKYLVILVCTFCISHSHDMYCGCQKTQWCTPQSINSESKRVHVYQHSNSNKPKVTSLSFHQQPTQPWTGRRTAQKLGQCLHTTRARIKYICTCRVYLNTNTSQLSGTTTVHILKHTKAVIS